MSDKDAEIYIAVPKDGATQARLIKGMNRNSIRNYLVDETWPTIRRAKTSEMHRLIVDGVKVEDSMPNGAVIQETGNVSAAG